MKQWKPKYSEANEKLLETIPEVKGTHPAWGYHGRRILPRTAFETADCQPVLESYRSYCNALGIRQIFVSHGNPKGNATRTRHSYAQGKPRLSSEIYRLFCIHDGSFALAKPYNEVFPHSSLGWFTLYDEYERWFLFSVTA